MKLVIALLLSFLMMSMLSPTAAAADQLAGDQEYSVTDVTGKKLGKIKTNATGSEFTYTPTGGTAETWTIGAGNAYSNAEGVTWKFIDDVGGWFKSAGDPSAGGYTEI